MKSEANVGVMPVILAVLAAVFMPVPAGAEPTGQLAKNARATIEGAWVRAMPPSQTTTAAYLTIHNAGETSLQIVGAHSDPPATIEMHSSRIVDGMMTMQQLDQVKLGPGESVQFGPGGMHLMLMDLKPMPGPGQQLKLCLETLSFAPVCTLAEVRKVAPSADDVTHNHQHH